MSEYAIQNPGLAAICFIILCYALTRPFRYWAVVQKRRLRSADIQAHGWPKAPLDADGDIIHKDTRP